MALTEKGQATSSTLSPSTPSLNDGTSEQDETFAPSFESRGHIYEPLTAKMGRLFVSLKVSPGMILEQIRSTCLESRVSGDHVGLSKCLVKASCTSLKLSDFRSHYAICLGSMSILVVS